MKKVELPAFRFGWAEGTVVGIPGFRGDPDMTVVANTEGGTVVRWSDGDGEHEATVLGDGLEFRAAAPQTLLATPTDHLGWFRVEPDLSPGFQIKAGESSSAAPYTAFVLCDERDILAGHLATSLPLLLDIADSHGATTRVLVLSGPEAEVRRQVDAVRDIRGVGSSKRLPAT